MANINRVTITGNLTRDPELRTLQTGNSVCSLRVAVNERRKNTQTGAWEDRPHYFNVTVWGVQGESCGKYLSKGRGVAIDGRLQWREWEQDGTKRQMVDIVAENVQFLGGGDSQNGTDPVRTTNSDIPANSGRPEPAGVTASGIEDDIPF